MFKTVQNTRVSQEVVQQILNVINKRELLPGDRLPGERQLVNELGVGRTSVREALRSLETMGVIEVRAGVGAFVRDPVSNIVQTSLPSPLLVDREMLKQLYGLRAIIETGAAAVAAREATAEELQKLRQAVADMERCHAADDLDGMVEADILLHRSILVATGNDILVQVVDSIADLLTDMRRVSLRIGPGVQETIAGHRAILEALEQRNPEAAKQAMADHLDTVTAKLDSVEITKTGEIVYKGKSSDERIGKRDAD